MQDELVNKQAWLGRLLRKTAKIQYYQKRKLRIRKPHFSVCMPWELDSELQASMYDGLENGLFSL